MQYLVPENLPNRAWVGVVAIGGNAVRHHAARGPGRAEEGLGRREVPCVAQPDVHQVAVLINCTVELLPLTLNAHIGLVHILTVAGLAVAPFAWLLTQEQGQPALPLPHSFVGKDATSLKIHFCQVSQA
jgi:hypothetical protein